MKKMRIWYIIGILTACLCIFGCGYREGVVQPSPKSYLLFTGHSAGAIVHINDLKPFRIKAPHESEPGTDENKPRSETTLYQLQPGKYRVRVEKDNTTVVDRVVILGEGMTTEIEVP